MPKIAITVEVPENCLPCDYSYFTYGEGAGYDDGQGNKTWGVLKCILFKEILSRVGHAEYDRCPECIAAEVKE